MVIEGAARLKFKQNFQAGLLGTALFSNSSAGFTSLRPGEDVSPEPYTVFLGPQFIYEKPFQQYISRIGASFSISLTGSNRTAYLANLHAGLGSFLSEAATIVRTKKETKLKTKIVKEVISMKAKTAEVTDNISFIFDSQMVNFKLNSPDLSEKSAAFISVLGEVLMREKDIWDKLIVEGHTDTRGSANFNQKLSALRAKTVATELEKSGVPASALVATGLGASKPLIRDEKSELDFARNRRVEIRILGLKDARRLQKSVDEVQAQFFGKSIPRVPIPQSTPETSNPPEPQEPVWDPGIDTPGGN
jgi:outer membrane protein OmpA-like peptidoglycan-associated protein